MPDSVHFKLTTIVALEEEWREAVEFDKHYTHDDAMQDQWHLWQSLLEEIGEVAEALTYEESKVGHGLKAELIQVACRALEWYQRLP